MTKQVTVEDANERGRTGPSDRLPSRDVLATTVQVQNTKGITAGLLDLWNRVNPFQSAPQEQAPVQAMKPPPSEAAPSNVPAEAPTPSPPSSPQTNFEPLKQSKGLGGGIGSWLWRSLLALGIYKLVPTGGKAMGALSSILRWSGISYLANLLQGSFGQSTAVAATPASAESGKIDSASQSALFAQETGSDGRKLLYLNVNGKKHRIEVEQDGEKVDLTGLVDTDGSREITRENEPMYEFMLNIPKDFWQRHPKILQAIYARSGKYMVGQSTVDSILSMSRIAIVVPKKHLEEARALIGKMPEFPQSGCRLTVESRIHTYPQNPPPWVQLLLNLPLLAEEGKRFVSDPNQNTLTLFRVDDSKS